MLYPSNGQHPCQYGTAVRADRPRTRYVNRHAQLERTIVCLHLNAERLVYKFRANSVHQNVYTFYSFDCVSYNSMPWLNLVMDMRLCDKRLFYGVVDLL